MRVTMAEALTRTRQELDEALETIASLREQLGEARGLLRVAAEIGHAEYTDDWDAWDRVMAYVRALPPPEDA